MMSNKVKKVAGKEGFQRINYLYQICNVLATQSRAGHVAALNYSNLAINVSKKTVQRLDIDIKRTICKRCRCLMIPGVTSRTRIKKKRVLHTCLKCQTSKIFDIRNEEYLPWTQRPESLVEVLDYSQDLYHNEQIKNKNMLENSNKKNKDKTQQKGEKIEKNASKDTKIVTPDSNEKHESIKTVVSTEETNKLEKNSDMDNKIKEAKISTQESVENVTDTLAINEVENELKKDSDSNLNPKKY